MMRYENLTERCRFWARVQVAAFFVGMVSGIITQSPWLSLPFLLIAFILNLPVMMNAKCPICGQSLIADSMFPWRLAPIFRLVAGSKERCAGCTAKEQESSEQTSGDVA